MRFRERSPQAVLVRGHDDDVNMVGHQTIGPDLGGGSASGISDADRDRAFNRLPRRRSVGDGCRAGSRDTDNRAARGGRDEP